MSPPCNKAPGLSANRSVPSANAISLAYRLRALPLLAGIALVVTSLWFPWLKSSTRMMNCSACGISVTYTAWQSANVGLLPLCIGLPIFPLLVVAVGVTVQRRVRIAFPLLLSTPFLGALGAALYSISIAVGTFNFSFARGGVVENGVLWGLWLCLAGYGVIFLSVGLLRWHRR